MNAHERLWFGDGAAPAVARGMLLLLAALYGTLAAARRRLYESGVLRVHEPVLPCVSVGNLTVGGTGKTPFAAWLAARLGERARPAIVLRGYGGDETAVHQRLNPGVPVFANPDRIAAVRDASAAGAQVVVLDDAFQHRRIARVADVVLLSVEQVMRRRRLLPAGPWREPRSAARAADLVVLTRKHGSTDAVRIAVGLVRADVPGVPVTSVHLAPLRLERLGQADSQPLEVLRDAPVVAFAGIGEPDAFRSQLDRLGARTTLRAFRDHHAYTREDARALAAAVPEDALAVCTLKDAVKLAPLWPVSRALWYVSQQLVVEEGAEHLDRLCARVLARVTAAAG